MNSEAPDKAKRTRPYKSLDSMSGSLGYAADWSDARHHYRRFASEFIGTFGFVFRFLVALLSFTLTQNRSCRVE